MQRRSARKSASRLFIYRKPLEIIHEPLLPLTRVVFRKFSPHLSTPYKKEPTPEVHRFCWLECKGSAYGGSETQDPRVAPFIWTQEHAPLHGWVALQRPLQTPTAPGCFCNCRAETVPAHRTVTTRAAKSVVLIFLPMIRSPFKQKSSGLREHPLPSYFFGGLSGPGSLTHAPDVPLKIWQMQTPPQCFVALQVPVQAGNTVDFFCNCRAETVPAQRTAMAIAARNVFLILLLMIHFSITDSPKMNMGRLFCRLGCDEPAYARVEAGLYDASAAQNVGTV